MITKGYKTTEFWVTAFIQFASAVGMIGHFLPSKYGFIAMAASTSAYAISRGLAKQGKADTNPNISLPDVLAGFDSLLQQIMSMLSTGGALSSPVAPLASSSVAPSPITLNLSHVQDALVDAPVNPSVAPSTVTTTDFAQVEGNILDETPVSETLPLSAANAPVTLSDSTLSELKAFLATQLPAIQPPRDGAPQ